MAQSTCVKCGNTQFEVMAVPSIAGSDYQWAFVQCANCGGVAGVLDHFTHGHLVDRLERIQKKLSGGLQQP
jgi:uncharacterized Zn finger protein